MAKLVLTKGNNKADDSWDSKTGTHTVVYYYSIETEAGKETAGNITVSNNGTVDTANKKITVVIPAINEPTTVRVTVPITTQVDTGKKDEDGKPIYENKTVDITESFIVEGDSEAPSTITKRAIYWSPNTLVANDVQYVGEYTNENLTSASYVNKDISRFLLGHFKSSYEIILTEPSDSKSGMDSYTLSYKDAYGTNKGVPYSEWSKMMSESSSKWEDIKYIYSNDDVSAPSQSYFYDPSNGTDPAAKIQVEAGANSLKVEVWHKLEKDGTLEAVDLKLTTADHAKNSASSTISLTPYDVINPYWKTSAGSNAQSTNWKGSAYSDEINQQVITRDIKVSWSVADDVISSGQSYGSGFLGYKLSITVKRENSLVFAEDYWVTKDGLLYRAVYSPNGDVNAVRMSSEKAISSDNMLTYTFKGIESGDTTWLITAYDFTGNCITTGGEILGDGENPVFNSGTTLSFSDLTWVNIGNSDYQKGRITWGEATDADSGISYYEVKRGDVVYATVYVNYQTDADGNERIGDENGENKYIIRYVHEGDELKNGESDKLSVEFIESKGASCVYSVTAYDRSLNKSTSLSDTIYSDTTGPKFQQDPVSLFDSETGEFSISWQAPVDVADSPKNATPSGIGGYTISLTVVIDGTEKVFVVADGSTEGTFKLDSKGDNIATISSARGSDNPLSFAVSAIPGLEESSKISSVRWSLTAYDKLGNKTVFDMPTIRDTANPSYDSTVVMPPELKYEATGYSITIGNVTAPLSDDGVGINKDSIQFFYKTAGSTWTNIDTNPGITYNEELDVLSFKNLPYESYEWKITAKDYFGNEVEYSAAIEHEKDAPTLTDHFNQTMVAGADDYSVTVTGLLKSLTDQEPPDGSGLAKDTIVVKYREIAGAETESWNSAASITVNPDNDSFTLSGLDYSKQYEFSVSAKDKFDNELAFGTTVSVIRDTVAPEFSYSVEPSAEWSNKDVTLTVVPVKEENASPVSYFWAASKDDAGTQITQVDSEGNYIQVFDKTTTFWLYAKDKAGNESERSEVSVRIDKENPLDPVFSVGDFDPVSGNVTITVTPAEGDTGSPVSVYYKIGIDGEKRLANGSFAVLKNCDVYLWSQDAAGNKSSEKTVEIREVIPPALTIVASTILPTNQNVTLTVELVDGIEKIQYSIDGKTNWLDYSADTGVIVGDNQTVYFRGLDSYDISGQISEYTVANIDRTNPETPIYVVSPDFLTNKDVTITLSKADEDTASLEYSFTGGENPDEWIVYTSPLVVKNNETTVYFRAKDLAGNYSNVGEYTVTNIDKVAPDAPVISASTEAPTNQDVVLTVTFSEDSVGRFYSYDYYNWQNYSDGPFIVDQNKTVWFKGVDSVGNFSISSYTVDVIDKVPPAKPTVTPDITADTTGNVQVSAAFADDSVRNEFSLDGGKTWAMYEKPVLFTENGSVIFRSQDALGNVSEEIYIVGNIDRTAPAEPVVMASTDQPTNMDVILSVSFAADSVRNEYSFDFNNWSTYDSALTIGDNKTVWFRSRDAAGNMSSASYTVSNIDRIAPVQPSVAPYFGVDRVYGDVLLPVTFASDSVRNEYSFDGSSWSVYPDSGLYLNSNGAVYLRSFDAAGNISMSSYEMTTWHAASMRPGLVAPTLNLRNYKATISWATPHLSAANTKIYRYEVSINGEVSVVDGRRYTEEMNFGTYTYSVRAIDRDGNIGEWSQGQTFTVKDITPPTVKITSVSVKGYDVGLSWSGYDKKGSIVSYEVRLDSRTMDTFSAETLSTVLYLNEGYVGKHTVEIVAFDGENWSKAAKKTVNIKDATPPEAVTGLYADLNNSKYSAVLSWNPAADNSGKIGYYMVSVDGGKWKKASKNQMKVSKLAIGDHSFEVIAYDKNKNASSSSGKFDFYVEDVTAPKTVSLKASVRNNEVNLSWNAVKDNDATGYASSYELWDLTNNVKLDTFRSWDSLSYGATLDQGVYSFQVKAFDAVGNVSVSKAKKVTVKTELVPVSLAMNEQNHAAAGAYLALGR